MKYLRILILCHNNSRLHGYLKFAEILNRHKIETFCVNATRYTTLADFKFLKHIPFPGILKLLKQFKPDLVLTDGYEDYTSTNLIKRVGCKIFFHLRADIWTEIYFNRKNHPFFQVRILYNYRGIVVERCFRMSDLILPNSEWLKKQVERRLPNRRTEILYTGIDGETWDPDCTNKNFQMDHPAIVGIFSFGQYIKVLGLMKFLKIIKKMPDVNFYFAGDGPYIYLVNQNYSSNMHLLGRLPQYKVKDLLASGDIFVHPSGLDALPRSLMEASLMKKPIIASQIGGIPEIVKNNKTGYLCEIDDTNSWIEKIRFLLDNPDIVRKFGNNARKHVLEKFNWNKIAINFLEILKNISYY